jgi:hypothetical protein
MKFPVHCLFALLFGGALAARRAGGRRTVGSTWLGVRRRDCAHRRNATRIGVRIGAAMCRPSSQRFDISRLDSTRRRVFDAANRSAASLSESALGHGLSRVWDSDARLRHVRRDATWRTRHGGALRPVHRALPRVCCAPGCADPTPPPDPVRLTRVSLGPDPGPSPSRRGRACAGPLG